MAGPESLYLLLAGALALLTWLSLRLPAAGRGVAPPSRGEGGAMQKRGVEAGLRGRPGRVLLPPGPGRPGLVRLEGSDEIWSAASEKEEAFHPGDRVRVVGRAGGLLLVEAAPGDALSGPAEPAPR
ncbi:MAG: NfeD family protein [Bacillota bacterium]|nr:NfeD family protein [Bacillota bacterium]